MKNRFLVGSTLALVFGMLGCGGGDSVKIDDIDQAYIEGFCESLRQCQQFEGEGELALIANVVDRETDLSCEELLTRLGVAEVPREVAGVEEGTVEYNGARAQRCLDAMVRNCVPFSSLDVLPECRGIFEGTVPAGGTCRISGECVPGTYCANDFQCAGTCTAQVAVGTTCTRDDMCSPNDGVGFTHCNTTAENPVPHCVHTTVTARVGEGGTCGELVGEGDEQSYAVCGPGLFCQFPEGSDTGTCSAPLAPGSTCDGPDLCANGACIDGQCLEVTMSKSPGEACDFEEGVLCDGTQHLACNTDTGVCETIGDGTVGSPCDADDDFLFGLLTCNTGLYCDHELETPSCQARKALGAICSDDVECESSYCSSDDRCEARPPICEPFEI